MWKNAQNVEVPTLNVKIKIFKLKGMKEIKSARTWSKEEINYLEEKWGTVSSLTIAKTLGRSESAILNKVQSLGLGSFLDNCDYVTWNQLQIALGTGGGGYKLISWVQNRNFPIRTKRVRSRSFKVVDLEEFWEWAEKNQVFLDFSNFEENNLGKEPDWVKEKRKQDIEKTRRYITTPWTKLEDEKLKKLLKDYKYNYSELSKIMRRTNGAIQRRILYLGLKERPLRESTHSKWEEWQLKILNEMIDKGTNYEYMSELIGKSVKAIRGKVFVLYGTENLDKVREKIRKEVACAERNYV